MIRFGVVLTCFCAACGQATPGDVVVTVSGEIGAQRGYPSSLFHDGWSVQFDRYLVSVRNVELVAADGERRAIAGDVLVDLQKGDVELGALEGIPAGRWGVSFVTAAPTTSTQTPDGHVATADVERMQASGFTYWLEGVAVRQPEGVFTFAMGFASDVVMSECTNGVDGTLGVVVPEGSAAQAEITIHVEHMFYDKLGTHRGVKLRFAALAAVADEAGVIRAEALGSQPILDLKDRSGQPLRDSNGTPVVYDPGAYDVTNLREFVTQSIVDQAHLNGGGLCSTSRLATLD